MTNSISFPALFDKVFEINRVAFHVFGKDVMWYGVILTVAVLAAAVYGMRRCDEFGWNQDQVVDGLLYCLPAAIIGARLYYVVCEWDYYGAHPGDIIKIWNGGLGIYGAIIATVLMLLWFCKKHKGDMLGAFDLVSLGFLLAQGIGRWANFVNAEAHGGFTDLPWGMVINSGQPVHPTFLYESIWDLAGFLFLHWYSKRRKFRGELALMYAGWYGMIRFLTEFLRTDSLFIGNTGIKTSQLIGGACVVISAGLLIYFYTTKKYPKPFGEQPETQSETEE